MIKNWAKLIIILLIITNLIFISTTVFYKRIIDNQVFKVYTFEGESNDIRLSNGIIIISSGKQIVNGGQIQYVGNKLGNIKSYSKTIYLDKQGSQQPVLSNTVLNYNSITGMTFPDELSLNRAIGEISSEELFSDKDINAFKDNLYFSLTYTQDDGNPKNFIVKLSVKKIL
ncbi:hypothetical protein [Desulfosporosinus youngiae]|uniref:Uncharacterized protein n=1 Tax=Desulfosporosinus youngiae DSM 17734 TaxID=768710 RepID=H5XTX3_9FIRM|nr:hypothetical protein [Desulfosporosinus youngiae]EHQ88931.1 hypothetical protein DesyoDRAFT_1806 [Desulfosporosinus youngiae DSM 17734]